MAVTTPDPLTRLAARYLWWKSADDAVADLDRLVVQVMDIGTLEDARWLLDHLGANRFRTALSGAEAGQLRPKSWAYWHYKLGVTPADQAPPPMPARVVQ